jgi:hypothetical protein
MCVCVFVSGSLEKKTTSCMNAKFISTSAMETLLRAAHTGITTATVTSMRLQPNWEQIPNISNLVTAVATVTPFRCHFRSSTRQT